MEWALWPSTRQSNIPPSPDIIAENFQDYPHFYIGRGVIKGTMAGVDVQGRYHSGHKIKVSGTSIRLPRSGRTVLPNPSSESTPYGWEVSPTTPFSAIVVLPSLTLECERNVKITYLRDLQPSRDYPSALSLKVRHPLLGEGQGPGVLSPPPHGVSLSRTLRRSLRGRAP